MRSCRGAPHLVGHHPEDGPAGQHNAVLPVLDDEGLRAGEPVLGPAEVVVDEHAEVAVHGHDLLHKHVRAVVQERVVRAVKGDVVGVAPAAAHTCGRTAALRGASDMQGWRRDARAQHQLRTLSSGCVMRPERWGRAPLASPLPDTAPGTLGLRQNSTRDPGEAWRCPFPASPSGSPS